MIEINNLTTIPIDEDFIKKIVRKVLIGENKERKRLSIALIGPSEIKKANKKYRKKNQTTDVLSFSNSEVSTKKFEMFAVQEKESLGEIIICPEKVKKNAKKYGLDFKTEFVKVLIHGILHLLGYNHEKPKENEKMKNKQDFYLSKIFIN